MLCFAEYISCGYGAVSQARRTKNRIGSEKSLFMGMTEIFRTGVDQKDRKEKENGKNQSQDQTDRYGRYRHSVRSDARGHRDRR